MGRTGGFTWEDCIFSGNGMFANNYTEEEYELC